MGAFKCNERRGGWGFVIRNDQGAVVKAGAVAEYFITDAFHAELLGFLAGLKEAASMGNVLGAYRNRCNYGEGGSRG